MIHTYSVNDFPRSNERIKALYKLAAGAAFLVGSAGATIALINESLGAPIALSAPTAIAIYFFLVKWVERDLWNNKLARSVLGITVPRVKGKYKGKVTSRHHNGKKIEENYEGDMFIFQTWSTLSIEFVTENTTSCSTGAFMTLSGSFFTLTLEYRVDPRNFKVQKNDAKRHTGISTMRFAMLDGEWDQSSVVEATYYTDHQQTGEIKLKLVKK
ncbi:hypothetical protein PS718_00519 [Pseudomonas fluorescens]|uniref:CD-NTase-associated protein 15 domain-containing protein n=1 Tax=Pseudomonas fluorescens TaxID=294 RepID=A0A5E7A3J8_PSEFL|nr:hypothetical protein [Pseudomonas fluorescens]VVN72645.1 hypothetical protein PS718_00519 [Pseudomonas fluorescens]